MVGPIHNHSHTNGQLPSRRKAPLTSQPELFKKDVTNLKSPQKGQLSSIQRSQDLKNPGFEGFVSQQGQDGFLALANKFEVQKLPVQFGAGDEELRPHEEDNDDHLNEDIDNIGVQLNNFNNDLYHVLFDLMNRQSGGDKTM
jgi:hypothetical protein